MITLGIIPARGGSKGVPKKNIRMVNGKPLIAYAVERALRAQSIDHVIVSTDSPEIAEVAKSYGAEVPFLRPSSLAEDSTPMLPVLEHAVVMCEKLYGDMIDPVILLDPTAPLRVTDDIEACLSLFRKGGVDAIISANEARRNPYFNMVSVDADGFAALAARAERPIYRRQDAPIVYDLNTVCWVFSRETIMVIRERIPPKTRIYLVPLERAIDLDTESDFASLEAYLNAE